MDKDSKPSAAAAEIMSQAVGQAQTAMENYLSMMQKVMAASPWTQLELKTRTDLSEKMKKYAEENIEAAFEYSRSLTHSKDLQDIVRAQTNFAQAQFRSLSEQMKSLYEAATREAAEAMKKPFNFSS